MEWVVEFLRGHYNDAAEVADDDTDSDATDNEIVLDVEELGETDVEVVVLVEEETMVDAVGVVAVDVVVVVVEVAGHGELIVQEQYLKQLKWVEERWLLSFFSFAPRPVWPVALSVIFAWLSVFPGIRQ